MGRVACRSRSAGQRLGASLTALVLDYRTATIIKASDEDVQVAWGGRVEIAGAAAYWLNCGVRLVVVTEGAKGATAFSAAGRVTVPGRSVVVRDTVGAGDAFHAALLAQIAALDLSAIRELLFYATTAAAITVSRDGADLPTAADVAASLHSRLTAGPLT